jgi:drug/metabolite transporter (DMT)-like permease
MPIEAPVMPEPDRVGSPHYPVSGWVEAFLYTIAIAVLSISYVVGQQAGAHPIAFILYAMLVSAIVLLAVTGFGPDALDIMLAPQSWLVGLGMIGIEVAYYILLDYVAPAHGSLLVRLAIPMSMVAGWVLVARRPPRLAAWGAAVVFLGIAPLLFTIGAEHRLAGAAAGIAAGAFSTLRSFAAEFHPWNRRATTVMEKLRVTGLVVLVSSFASLALAGAAAVTIAAGLVAPFAMMPTAAQMLHGPTVLLAIVVGSVILTAMAVLSFSAVVKITTENLMAVHAFTPVSTLLVQMLATAIGLIPAYAFDAGLMPAMAVVILGVLIIFAAARHR